MSDETIFKFEIIGREAVAVEVAFEEATVRGDGSIAFGGQLIDPPIVERAIRTLELAESLE